MDMFKIETIGSYWEKGDKKRYYFDNINELIGLKFTYRNYKGILRKSRAYLNGKQISLKIANKMDCREKQIYYDVSLKRMECWKSVDPRSLIAMINVFK